jgi:hypothetical protein
MTSKLKKIVIAFVVLLLLAVCVCIWLEYDSRKAVERAQQALIDAGAPMTPASVFPPVIPDEQNALVHYQRLDEFVKSNPEINDAFEKLRALTAEDGEDPCLSAIYTFRINDDLWTDVKGLIVSPLFEEYFSMIDTIAEYDYLRPDFENEPFFNLLIPHVGLTRMASGMLLIRAADRFNRGYYEDVSQMINQVFRLARHQAQCQTFINLLVSASIQNMAFEFLEALDQKNESALPDIAFDLPQWLIRDYWQRTADLERLGMEFMVFEVIQSGSSDFKESGIGYSFVNVPLLRWRIRYDHAAYITIMSRIRLLSEISHQEFMDTYLPAIDSAFKKAERSHPVTHFIFPSFGKLFERLVTADALNELAAAGLALSRYHDANGEYPTSLEALVPDFLPIIPFDHFANGPLVYRLEADGYALYSLGSNLIDNGGIAPEYFSVSDDDSDLIWSGRGSILLRNR